MNNKPKSKLLSPSIAAALVAQASAMLSPTKLQEYIGTLQVRRNRGKHRNSGAGSKMHRLGNNRGPFKYEREMARRVRQMAKGMIPAHLICKVAA